MRSIIRLVCILSIAIGVAAQDAPKVRTDMLVSTDWLAQHLKDPNVIVIHFGRYRGEYDRGHIPGARFLRTNELISDNQELTFELPRSRGFKRLWNPSALGIKNES